MLREETFSEMRNDGGTVLRRMRFKYGKKSFQMYASKKNAKVFHGNHLLSMEGIAFFFKRLTIIRQFGAADAMSADIFKTQR